MSDYVSKIIIENPKCISICFYIQQNEVIEIGKKIKKSVSNNFGKFMMKLFPKIAKMNGYDWEGFINYYLQKNYPEVKLNMETDSEVGMYVAFYKFSNENDVKADKLKEIIINIVEDNPKLLEKIKNDGKQIKWNLN